MSLSNKLRSASSAISSDQASPVFDPIVQLAQKIASAAIPGLHIQRKLENGSDMVIFSKEPMSQNSILGVLHGLYKNKPDPALIISSDPYRPIDPRSTRKSPEPTIRSVDLSKELLLTSSFKSNLFGSKSNHNNPAAMLADIADWLGRNVDKEHHAKLGELLDSVESEIAAVVSPETSSSAPATPGQG